MLLINPVHEPFGGFLSRYVPIGLPMASGTLAAYLRKHQLPIRLVNEQLLTVSPSVLRQLTAGLERPYIFGLTCLTAHAARVYTLARMCKAEFPDSTVIVGGVHATALPEEPLQTGCVDYVVRGQGEEILRQLYQALRGGQDPAALDGLSFRRDGMIVHNPDAAVLPELDLIPPFPYELFDHPKYDKGAILSSRGCPYNL